MVDETIAAFLGVVGRIILEGDREGRCGFSLLPLWEKVADPELVEGRSDEGCWTECPFW
ncbi:hypothetical protein MAXJ12_16376 [Mesorhizobium alhagi CCNWXJ12-2]|jgi:hypothetical protein|uniref:Uncharacterized protein n=1 Tax=Mesorhizobium alhagi CCNWXJ12-2 TaxID=1107882 RepID=H0HSY4_9HYPH|nr:hypothetical protein MAXJ12_16376 [Mesorhizobium alhagi CCNWXJ12-2]